MSKPNLALAEKDQTERLDAAITAFVSQPILSDLSDRVRDVRELEVGALESVDAELRSRPLLVDLDRAESDALVEALSERAPDTPLLVIGDDLSGRVVRALLKMRASDVMSKSATAAEFSERLNQLMSKAQTATGGESSSGTCHIFTGAVGGAGATTLAIEMACYLAKSQPDAKVCLIDLNISDGMIAPYLEAQSKLDTSLIAEAGERLDPAMLDALAWTHSTGVKLIAAPRDYEAHSRVQAESILMMLDVACSSFDHVVVDMPRQRFPWSQPVLEAADEVLIVSEFTVPSLHAGADMARDISLIRGSGTVSEPKLILNRMSEGGKSFSVAKASKAIGWPIDATVRSDWKAARSAVNLGMPVIEVQAKSPLVKDSEALVQSLLPNLVPQSKPKKKGLFG